jgi:hypothetical protein
MAIVVAPGAVSKPGIGSSIWQIEIFPRWADCCWINMSLSARQQRIATVPSRIATGLFSHFAGTWMQQARMYWPVLLFP